MPEEPVFEAIADSLLDHSPTDLRLAQALDDTSNADLDRFDWVLPYCKTDHTLYCSGLIAPSANSEQKYKLVPLAISHVSSSIPVEPVVFGCTLCMPCLRDCAGEV